MFFFLAGTHQNSGVEPNDFAIQDDSPPWGKDARGPFDTDY